MTSPQVEKDIDLIPTTPGEVAKALLYIALAALGVLQFALSDGELSLIELLQAIVMVAGVVPVYLLAGRIAKTVAAFIVAAAQAVIALLVNGATGFADISLSDWVGVIIGSLAAIGILLVPNAPKPGPSAVVPTPSPQAAISMQGLIDEEKIQARTGPHHQIQ